jgi:tetratricopeptide (TPR) repeat protein
MLRRFWLIPLAAALALPGWAQEEASAPRREPRASDPVPRSAPADRPYSSSRDTLIPLDEPPRRAPAADAGDVHELRPYNPHRAMKNVEVGEFYLKRRNYPAALSRFREALEHKPNDAIATYRVAETLERMEKFDEALEFYRAYLKILPNGPLAPGARSAIERLEARSEAAQASPPPAQPQP